MMGKINLRAIVKVAIVVSWIIICGIVIPAKTDIPRFPAIWLIKQWGEDIQNFSQNATNWTSLKTQTQRMYYVIPMFYILAFLFWFIFIFRLHRKSFYINGVKEGTVIWIHGHPYGHVYDVQCILFNRFRHFDDFSLVNRPISGNFMEDQQIIYYRPGWFHNPLEFNRAIVNPANIYLYSVQAIAPVDKGVTKSQYRNRIVDMNRSYLVYVDLRLDPSYSSIKLDRKHFEERHKDEQEHILRNTWRMGRAEPGTAMHIIRNSSYAIPDRTVEAFWKKLNPKDQEDVRGVWNRAKNP